MNDILQGGVGNKQQIEKCGIKKLKERLTCFQGAFDDFKVIRQYLYLIAHLVRLSFYLNEFLAQQKEKKLYEVQKNKIQLRQWKSFYRNYFLLEVSSRILSSQPMEQALKGLSCTNRTTKSQKKKNKKLCAKHIFTNQNNKINQNI